MSEQEPMTRLPSREEEEREEALAEIYKMIERGEASSEVLREKLEGEVSPGILGSLEKQGLLVQSGGKVRLTEKGQSLARVIIRRSRLSERLLTDVLEIKSDALSSAACQFEHVLSEEMADSICTLLGHPTECPHQNPIPPGECCRRAETQIHSVVVPLAKLEPGRRAKIAYLQFKKSPDVYRLLSLGIVPGETLRVIQRFPTFVIEAGESQLALDESIAAYIFVRPSAHIIV